MILGIDSPKEKKEKKKGGEKKSVTDAETLKIEQNLM